LRSVELLSERAANKAARAPIDFEPGNVKEMSMFFFILTMTLITMIIIIEKSIAISTQEEYGMKTGIFLTILTLFVLFLLFPGIVCGEDIIRLTNGQELRGKIIEENNDSIVIDGKYGHQEIDRGEIESIQRGFDFESDFKRKASALGPRDSSGWYNLGLFCEENNEEEKAKECFQKAIKVDPENLAAREKLGHKKLQGKWYESEADYYGARGWVDYGGVWMTPEDKDKYMAGLVKRDDGTWISKKVWDAEEKKRRVEHIKKKEKEKKASGKEEDPGEDESGDAGAAIRRKARKGAMGRKNPVPKDKKERKNWVRSYKQQGGWNNHYESKYYLFISNGPPDKTKYYAQLMDQMYKEYIRIFAYKEKFEQPFLVHMYKDHQEFMSKDHKGPGVGGYYDGSKIVCFLGRVGSLNTQTVLFHEGTHQFQGLIWPDMGRLTGTPGGIWMIEGLATYFECAEIVRGGIATGQVNKGRLGTLRSAMAQNRYTKFGDLLRMVQRGYTAFHYAHGWGACYFLIHSSSKMRDKFKLYFKEFKKEGCKPIESFHRIFPWDEDKIDHEWRNYILKLR